ncbi:MAG: YdeI/OmpD-associated family protein [Bacilli bacterium]|nr:YdeI/OmpD-associated family protein [Bacilli bacterium]MBN2876176.1 YdeI/OmpD-associated family protein [Bacilli bacterium]
MNEKIEQFFSKPSTRKEELAFLRQILNSFELKEEWKWGKPCYTRNQNNVVLIQDFKSYLALMFFKGTLMADKENLLVRPGENSNIARQMHFEDLDDIKEKKVILEKYIEEAIRIEEQGLKIQVDRKEIVIPQELEAFFGEVPKLRESFDSLTPGRQRAYLMFFASAKQVATRINRIQKYIPNILAGKGMNDPY